MLNRTWKIVLLIIALIYPIWPDLLGGSIRWIALIAIIILLIGEFVCKSCGPMMPDKPAAKPARKRKR